ncbi:MAG: GerMN domain-containing protein [Defluviitaleaceae bacterium]|nr:GerMN domain-containing protein [Defluviitaleaceae bacterium]
MKKIIKLFAILTFALLVVACGNNDGVGDARYNQFMPFQENVVLVYSMEITASGQMLSYTTFTSFIRDHRMQRILMMDDGSVIVEIIEMADEMLVNVVAGDTMDGGTWLSPHVDSTDHRPNTHFNILPENPQLGDRWIINPYDQNTSTREVTSVGVSVLTPAGTFEAIEVTTFDSDGVATLRTYFAEGVGVVKETGLRHVDGEEQISHTTRLTDVIEGGLLGNINIAFLGEDGNMPTMQINFTTNNDMLDILNQALRDAAYILFGRQLPNDVVVNRAFINAATQNLHLDFSAGFLRQMQEVESEEVERDILLAIVDTFGSLYHASAVTITVDDQPYNGNFVSIASMEFWDVGTITARIHEQRQEQQSAVALEIARALHQPYVDTMASVYSAWRNGADENQLRPMLAPIFTEFTTENLLAQIFDEYWGIELTPEFYSWHPDQVINVDVFSDEIFQITTPDYFLQFVDEGQGFRIDHVGAW